MKEVIDLLECTDSILQTISGRFSASTNCDIAKDTLVYIREAAARIKKVAPPADWMPVMKRNG
jgi:hypothetical protein